MHSLHRSPVIIDEAHALPKLPPFISVSGATTVSLGTAQGPKRVRTERRTDGQAYEIEEWFTSGHVFHRVGGPAVIERTSEGKVAHEEHYVQGRLSRLDGPAQTSYSPATGQALLEYYYLDGVEVRGGMEMLVRRLRGRKTPTMRRLLEDSPYRALLDEGLRPIEVVKGLGHGVTSVEGVRQVIGGAPVEWVRAWEEGQTESS